MTHEELEKKVKEADDASGCGFYVTMVVFFVLSLIVGNTLANLKNRIEQLENNQKTQTK